MLDLECVAILMTAISGSLGWFTVWFIGNDTKLLVSELDSLIPDINANPENIQFVIKRLNQLREFIRYVNPKNRNKMETTVRTFSCRVYQLECALHGHYVEDSHKVKMSECDTKDYVDRLFELSKELENIRCDVILPAGRLKRNIFYTISYIVDGCDKLKLLLTKFNREIDKLTPTNEA